MSQESVCELYIIHDGSHWDARLSRKGADSSIGRGNTPGEALDRCVKWATDRGLFPNVEVLSFNVMREDPRARV